MSVEASVSGSRIKKCIDIKKLTQDSKKEASNSFSLNMKKHKLVKRYLLREIPGISRIQQKFQIVLWSETE